MFSEALTSRLQVLEEEILRLTRLAAQLSDGDEQDKYFRLAQDVQREARQLRKELRKLSAEQPAAVDPAPPSEGPGGRHYGWIS